MWTPNIELENWLVLFPELREHLPLECLCGQKAYGGKPYIIKEWVGIITENCSCGLGPTSVCIPRSKKFEKELKELILNFA